MYSYYVYCFLDTRKKREYIFNDIKFEYEPIYIGKGKGNRVSRHFTLCKTLNSRFYSKLLSIIKSEYKPEIIYLIRDLTEIEAFEKEKYFINLIGRIENGGTLTNLTDGGEGQSGLKMSDETKYKMSLCKIGEKNFNFGKHMSNETKLSISISKRGKPSSNKGNHLSDETKTKMSIKGKGRIGSKNSMFGKHHSKETIEKIRNKPKKFGIDNPNYHREYTEEQKTSDEWKLRNTEGVEIVIKNLCNFCKENNLNSTCMRDIYYGRQKKHKNWISVEKLTDNVKKKKDPI